MQCFLKFVQSLKKGQRCLLTSGNGDCGGMAHIKIDCRERTFRAGTVFKSNAKDLFKVVSGFWIDNNIGAAAYIVEILSDIDDSNIEDVTYCKHGFSLAYITLSDKGAFGLREDTGGPIISEMLKKELPLCVSSGYIIPDEKEELKSLLLSLSTISGYDLIITTGGTGVSPRDVSPMATLDVIERRLTGFEHAIMSCGLSKTPHAMISCAVAGTLQHSVIINLPGSPKAVKENLGAVIPALKHTIEKLQGDESDCAGLKL